MECDVEFALFFLQCSMETGFKIDSKSAKITKGTSVAASWFFEFHCMEPSGGRTALHSIMDAKFLMDFKCFFRGK